MSDRYKYIIVGGGLTGAWAINGIREIDREAPILLIGSENIPPYERPPLTKQLWSGKKRIADIFAHEESFYADNNVALLLGTTVESIDSSTGTVRTSSGASLSFEKLLLATGGAPRTLRIPGGTLPGILYYRYLPDYKALRLAASEGKTALIIGGGFIGTEIAAALSGKKVSVTMIFPAKHFTENVFPAGLGQALMKYYEKRGILIIAEDEPVAIQSDNGRFITGTKRGERIESDIVVAGIGIAPSIDIAQRAGLEVGNGVIVNEYLQTSSPNIFAAGDVANFPYTALGKRMRIEHWDNAVNQGKLAGRNMAGAHEPYEYMPYFYSDLFDFGYEAVGDVSTRLEVFEDWQEEYEKGVIYYREDSKVRGVMMCNVWDKVPVAREMIRANRRVANQDLKGVIA
jgi:NADPH-dependent 2,4-dienoyl-CoA reductase/sulfur reductase-like enzyme